MRGGGRILVLLGLVLGLVTAGGMFFVLNGSTGATEKQPTKMVVVALQNIPQRTEIPADAIVLREWPEASLPQTGTFESLEKVIGKLALVPIYPGQLILDPMVVDKKDAEKTRSDASILLTEGKVAVAFPVTELSSVANALQVGDVVDVLLTLSPANLPTGARTTATTTGTEGLPVTQLMLQNLQILQIGTWGAAAKDKNQPTSALITFALSRQDALALKAAREQGTIELVLRPALKDKDTEFKTESVTLQYLNRRFNFNLAPASTK